MRGRLVVDVTLTTGSVGYDNLDGCREEGTYGH